MGTIHRQNRKDVEAVPIHNKEVSGKKEEIGERFRSEIDIEGIVFLFEVGHALCEALKVALLAAHTHIAALSSSSHADDKCRC